MTNQTPTPLQLCVESPTDDQTFSQLGKIQALLDSPTLYSLGALIPQPERTLGGQPRRWPGFAYVLFKSLVSVFGSARQVDVDLGVGGWWQTIRNEVRLRFPDNPEMWLPETPMRRHNFNHLHSNWMIETGTLKEQVETFCAEACAHAYQAGLCHEDGGGSYAHPAKSRTLYGDGTIDRPMIKQPRTKTRFSKTQNKRVPRRHDPDAHLQGSGTGLKIGNKTVTIAVRNDEAKLRFIVGLDAVPKGTREADVALALTNNIVNRLPGAQHLTWDGELRGKDLARVYQMGITSSSRLHTRNGAKKSKNLGLCELRYADGSTRKFPAFAIGGPLHIIDKDDQGNDVHVELVRQRAVRQRNKDKTWRWYGEYALMDGQTVVATTMIRLNNGEEENFRFIPYEDTIGRRVDAENLHRTRKRTWEDGRSMSLGARSQLYDNLAHSLLWNAQARVRARNLDIETEIELAA